MAGQRFLQAFAHAMPPGRWPWLRLVFASICTCCGPPFSALCTAWGATTRRAGCACSILVLTGLLSGRQKEVVLLLKEELLAQSVYALEALFTKIFKQELLQKAGRF